MITKVFALRRARPYVNFAAIHYFILYSNPSLSFAPESPPFFSVTIDFSGLIWYNNTVYPKK